MKSKANPSTVSKRNNDVMVVPERARALMPCSFASARLNIKDVDQNRVVAVSVNSCGDGGRRTRRPQMTIVLREKSDDADSKSLSLDFEHQASKAGTPFDVLSFLRVGGDIVLLTGTRELHDFAVDPSFKNASAQTIELVDTLAQINARKKSPNGSVMKIDRAFFAGDLDPMRFTRDDLVTIMVDTKTGEVRATNIVAIDVDPSRQKLVAFRMNDRGERTEIVEIDTRDIEVAPELLARPSDPMWALVATAPEGKLFYYASRATKMGRTDDARRQIYVTYVGGFGGVIPITGERVRVNPAELTYVGSRVIISRIGAINGKGIGVASVVAERGPMHPVAFELAFGNRVHEAYRPFFTQLEG